jgi:hypothetical protein
LLPSVKIVVNVDHDPRHAGSPTHVRSPDLYNTHR